MSGAAPYAVVETVGFGIAGDDDNAREAVVEVTNYELFSGAHPVSGGCFDARMGTTDHHYGCVTCGLQRRDDPGHPGYMRSRTPLLSPLFVKEVRRWLRVVCLACGAPVVGLAKYAGVSRARRLAEAAKAATEGTRCPACRAVHPKIVKTEDDYFSFEAHYPAPERPRRLLPADIREALERVTAETAEALGRPYLPGALVLWVILVPPNTIRPGVRMGFGPGGASSHHDVTNMVQYIVRRNMTLPETPPTAEERRAMSAEDQRAILNAQQIYYDLILGAAATNAANGSTGRRGTVLGTRSVRSIVRTFARKEGRIRKNLLGKRVFYISRSTISGNPHLKIDEVGYPLAFARVIQVEEVVQEFNRDRLMVYFLNGDRQYPGCTRVVKRSTGMAHRIEGFRRDFQLEVGDTIFRDAVSGDKAYFNRAPSLEASSIGVHTLVILEDPAIHTFQMNVAACAWYNADFDGDQMNLWVPHTVMAGVEADYISGVAARFISSMSSGPVNGQVQDSIVGCFELTRAAARVDKYHAMALFARTRAELPDFSEAAGYTGRELAGRLLAQTPVNLVRAPQWYRENLAPYIDYAPSETLTEIRRGRVVTGVLDKATVGAGAGGVFHLISHEYGPRKALDMIYALQQMAIAYVGARGLTVGTADMVVPRAALGEIHRIVAGLRREAEVVTGRLLRGELLPPIGMTTHDYYEKLMLEALKAPDELLRPIVSSLDVDWNGFFKMIATSSKGDIPNLIHIAGTIGQVELSGARIAEQFGFRRTCVYFPRFATAPEAYGFIENGYVAGMTAPEFLFADMIGRFDLISKALSTASTGYQNRKAVMALQSDIVDNFRRLSKDTRVVQLVYGGDGLDTRFVEQARFRAVFLDDAALAAAFRLDLAAAAPRLAPGAPPPTPAEQAACDEAFARVREDRAWYREAFLRLEDTEFEAPRRLADGGTAEVRQVPVDVARLVRDVRIAREEGGGPVRNAPADVAAMAAAVADFCARLPYVYVNDIQERRGAPIPPQFAAAAALFRAHVREELAPPALVGLAPADLAFILQAARLHYSRALVEYGTAAGILAAQAVSAPLTQYMLDSHHRSVAGGTNKSGIIRPGEIFGARPVKAEQSPAMLLRLRPEYEEDRAGALQVANQIELMTLAQFVGVWDLLVEPPGEPRYPPFIADRAWIAEFARLHPLLPPPGDLTHWCVRLELDRPTMILKSMSLEALVGRLRARHPAAYVVHTPENVPLIVVRVYFRAAHFRRGAQDEAKVVEFVKKELLPLTIRGVPGILSAKVVEVRRHIPAAGGGLRRATVYAVETVGTNIYGVLLNRRVDPLRIVSSSVGDTEKVFGVSAARQTIIREVRRLMGSKSPNVRHLSVWADEMTRTGRVTSIEKGGVNVRDRDNIFLRMAMSAPTEVLQEAAASGASARVYGVAPYLMLGRPPRLGTLWSEFSMDEEYVRANLKSVDSVLDDL